MPQLPDLSSASSPPRTPASPSHLCPLSSRLASCDALSEKLPNPVCITKTGQTDPARVSSLRCPQCFLICHATKPKRKHGGSVCVNQKENKISRRFFCCLCAHLLQEQRLARTEPGQGHGAETRGGEALQIPWGPCIPTVGYSW